MRRSWQRAGSRAARLALTLVAAVLIGLLAGGTSEVAALSLPGWGKPGRPQPQSLDRVARGLQEVAPPRAAQQFREVLATRKPRIAIETPADGSMLPDGPWILRLQVEDWPLVDAGDLGMGPHLVVQLDDESPRRLTTAEVTMPPLAPGSHRLTVYAAWPWGEAVKDPGAWRQIRLHRVAANALALPAQGSPQLLAVSPSGPVAAEPVLVDWLLIDTPLQNLRAEDASWRLRISVNGDSFLVDRQTPLWLKGWRAGSNALQLELVDPRGESLNPPFNSLVREVRLTPSAVRPAWLGSELTASELARLLGEAPSEPEQVQAPEPEREPEQEPGPRVVPPPPQQELVREPEPAPGPPEPEPSTPEAERPSSPGPAPAPVQPEEAVPGEEIPTPEGSAPGQREPSAVGGQSAGAGAQPPVDADDVRSAAPPQLEATPTPSSNQDTDTADDAALRGTPDTVEEGQGGSSEGSRPPEASGAPVPGRKRTTLGQDVPAGSDPAPAGELETHRIPAEAPWDEPNVDDAGIGDERPGPLARLRRRLGR